MFGIWVQIRVSFFSHFSAIWVQFWEVIKISLWHSYLHSHSKRSLLHSFFWRSKIGNCRETLWSNLITGRIIHQGKKAAKDVLQRFVCLMLSTFPFCTTTEMSSWKVIQKDAFLPLFPFFVRHPKNSFLFIGKKNQKSFSLM